MLIDQIILNDFDENRFIIIVIVYKIYIITSLCIFLNAKLPVNWKLKIRFEYATVYREFHEIRAPSTLFY